jgi:hypothetical protein
VKDESERIINALQDKVISLKRSISEITRSRLRCKYASPTVLVISQVWLCNPLVVTVGL